MARHRLPRSAGRGLVALGLAGAFVLLAPAAPAQAHAFLTGSNPADGTVLTTAPSALRLEFSESVVLAATHVDIVDSSGRHLRPTRLHLEGGGDSTEEPVQLVADLPALARSAYRVSWETLSSDDLHQTSGVLVFGVDAAVTASPFVEPTPRAEEAALRWLLFGCIAATLGGWLALRLYRRAGGPVIAQRRCRRIAVVAPAIGAVLTVGLLVDQLLTSESTVGQLLASGYGARWMLREAGFVLLTAAVLVRLRASRMRASLVVGGAGCVCLGSALLGHSGAGAGWLSTRPLADAAHLAAAATWSGLLVVALIVVLPALRAGGTAAGASRDVVRGFALPAAACVSIMVVTGVYLTSGVVGSVDAALRTVYGRTLLAKLAVVVVIGALGLVNSGRLRRPRSGATPRRTITAEAVLAVVVLGLAAVLTSGQPAREPEFVAGTAPAAVPVMDTAVADLQESLALRPNRPGRNVALIEVHDTRRPAPGPIRRVLVRVVGADGVGSTVVADRLTDGRWSASLDLDAPGRTPVLITVQRPGLADTTHNYRWVVDGAPVRTRPALVSTAPLAATLRAWSVVLAVGLALGWGVAVRRRLAGRTGRGAIAAHGESGRRSVQHLVGVP